jgi:hypothetical protein
MARRSLLRCVLDFVLSLTMAVLAKIQHPGRLHSFTKGI